VDVGTSGGVYGLERGYSLMIGGETSVVKSLDPIFKALAPGFESAMIARQVVPESQQLPNKAIYIADLLAPAIT
jgi:6-phosphogluconate dehydrogenase (decarboxylating)